MHLIKNILPWAKKNAAFHQLVFRDHEFPPGLGRESDENSQVQEPHL